jgi:hypothetical protein
MPDLPAQPTAAPRRNAERSDLVRAASAHLGCATRAPVVPAVAPAGRSAGTQKRATRNLRRPRRAGPPTGSRLGVPGPPARCISAATSLGSGGPRRAEAGRQPRPRIRSKPGRRAGSRTSGRGMQPTPDSPSRGSNPWSGLPLEARRPSRGGAQPAPDGVGMSTRRLLSRPLSPVSVRKPP